MPRKAEAVRGGSVWPVIVSAVLLSGGVAAAVAAATVRMAVLEAPRFGSVRLGEMTAAWTTRAAAEGRTAEDARVWGAALEAALDRVAAEHGAILLPARAIAAGAPDMTVEVEAALAEHLARRTGGSAGVTPGDGR